MGRPNLRLRREINGIRKSGRLYRGKWVHVRIGESTAAQTVISVRKQFGNAVHRNVIRRRLKALIADLLPEGHPSQLLQISVGDRSSGVSYVDLHNDLVDAFRAFGLLDS